MKVINLKNYGVIVFNTKLTKVAIEKLAKHIPDALKLKDEEGNDVFAIGFGTNASISNYGVNFNKVDSEGKALITIGKTMENEEIAEEFASILMKVKEVEVKAEAAYAALEEQLLEVTNSIENPLEVTAEEERGEE